MRVGITQRVEVVETHGERRDCLDQAWAALLVRAGWVPVPLACGVMDAGLSCADYLDAVQVQALVLSGGNDLSFLPDAANSAPERDTFERSLVEAARAKALPILGVCRGLQLIASMFGAKLSPVAGHAGSRHHISTVGDTWPLGERSEVNSFHHWGVSRLDVGAEGLEVLAVDAEDYVEALCVSNEPIVGIMWHPERAPQDVADLKLMEELFRRR